MKYVDLFCGLGAFHTSFNKLDGNHQCVLACDIDEKVRKIYKENYGIEPYGNIWDIKEFPDFDCLCAGFPCQPFSIAGKKQGFDDKEKGNLFYAIMDIVDKKKPNTLILENVKNLKTIHDGKTFNTIIYEIEKRGYNVSYKVLDSKYFNSPQSRQRIFLVCDKKITFDFPNIKNEIVPVSSIIDFSDTTEINLDKYNLEECTGHMKFKLINKETNKGGRQGERVYNIDSCGTTVCASSGGPGAKTGLYYINGVVRRLNVKETLQMFGFQIDYKHSTLPNADRMLFYLGNSIVVNVLDAILTEYITQSEKV